MEFPKKSEAERAAAISQSSIDDAAQVSIQQALEEGVLRGYKMVSATVSLRISDKCRADLVAALQRAGWAVSVAITGRVETWTMS